MVWTKVLDSQQKHGGVRGLIVDGEKIICTGYVYGHTPGFLFVSDESNAAVWELTKDGNLVKENILNVNGLGQGAKIRKDLKDGYILTSTVFAVVSRSSNF